ncbi:MAG: hypothetical protein SOV63_10100 [Pyramidobacter porci]|uniref:hypothetical protein n=1 Tax=Pyramidobacter porci TaxID=2605789 RepID=UPI002A75EF32|nr:hypothetical protein [Pyramidobacter porci]MDY2649140.1 hypothetical protein [Pyramidobacter porci]
MGEVEQLARALDIVASRCPHGLAAIVGDAPPPSDAEIIAAATWRPAAEREGTHGARHTEGPVPSLAEKVMAVTAPLEKVGWDAITAAGREVRKLFPQDWEAYRLHITYIDAPVQWRMEGQTTLEKIAAYCRMDTRTVQRRRRQVPERIARGALLGVQRSLDLA